MCGCSHGLMQTVTLGPSFGDRNGIVLAVEVSAIAHETFEPPRPPQPLEIPRERESHRYLGIAATLTSGTEWQPTGGLTGFASIGVDYLPFLFPEGGMVGFGGHVAYAAGEMHGVYAVAPRLRFAVPVATLWGAPFAIGLMLRGQFGLDGGSGAGPAIVVSRVSL